MRPNRFIIVIFSFFIFHSILASNPPGKIHKSAKFYAKTKVWVLDSDQMRSVWYNNGKLKAQGKYISRHRVGPWKFFYNNGNKEAIGQYRHGKKTGKWNLYSRKGHLFASGNFNRNYKTGMWQHYYPGGKIKLKGNYIGGLKTGQWNHYYQNGQIFYSGMYKEGRLDGLWSYYFKNGSVQQKGQFINGVRYGKWKICIQPDGPCGVEFYAHKKAPRQSRIGNSKNFKTKNTKNPAALLDSLDTGGVPDNTPQKLKINPWKK